MIRRVLLCFSLLLLCSALRHMCVAAPIAAHAHIPTESSGAGPYAADAPTDYDEAPISSPPVALTTGQYDAYLSRVQRDLNSVSKTSVSAGDIATVQRDLSPIVRCDVISEGTVFVVDNRPMRSTISRILWMRPISKQTQTIADLGEQLTMVRQGLSKPGSQALADRDSRLARAVLRTNEFGSTPIAPPTAIQKKITAWGDELGRFLDKLVHRLHIHWKPFTAPAALGASTAITILTIIGVIAVVGLVTLLIVGIVNYIQKRSSIASSYLPTSGLAINEQEAELVSQRDYTRLIQLAKQNASEGEYRNGYRLIYLATLVLLDTAGIIRIDRSKTNWEYLRNIQRNGHDAVHGLTTPLTAEFDRIWYGYGNVNADKFDEGIRLFEQIHAELNSNTLAAAGGRAKV
jgi:hypothetical protein